MRLCSVSVADFRNIYSVHVEPGESFNLLYGLNGQGKTNLLETIYLLGSPRSFRTSRLPELIRHGERQAQIMGTVESGGIENSLRLVIEAAGRKVEIDGKSVHKASELHGKLNSVLFSPDDTGMVRMGPESRRRYLDRAVYMGDIGYLLCWHSYQRILKQRNHLLKSPDRAGLDVSAKNWLKPELKSSSDGSGLLLFWMTSYKNIMQLFRVVEKHPVSVINRTVFCQQSVIRLEKSLWSCLCGINALTNVTARRQPDQHRDDLSFMLDERPLKAFGSQGQQKSFVLALKMAEMDNLQDIFGEAPLLLLDDMSSELDARRNQNLMEFLTTRKIQVFITTTERSPALLEAAPHCAVFHVENGNLTFEGS